MIKTKKQETKTKERQRKIRNIGENERKKTLKGINKIQKERADAKTTLAYFIGSSFKGCKNRLYRGV